MSKNLIKLIFFYIIGILPSSCKTAHTSDEDVLNNADKMSWPGEPSDDELMLVPPSLWSPFQRQTNAAYYFLVAEQMSLGGDIQKAMPLFEMAYNLDPNPHVGAKLVASKAAVGLTGDALLDIRKMTLLYPKNSQLHLLYGQLLGATSGYEEAVKQLEQAIELDPQSELAYISLIQLHQQEKQIDRALVVAKDFTQKIPSSVTAWSILSRLYLASGQKKKALVPARRAYDMQAQNPELILVYALALELNKKPKEAIQLYEQLFQLDPTNEKLIGRMIELYGEVGELEDALQLLDELAKLSAESRPGIEMQRALILWELKKFDKAAKVLDELATNFPESDRLQYMAGLGQEKMERWDKALAFYAKIPENSKLKVPADYRRAIIQKELKKFNEATAIAEEILANNPESYDAYVLLATIYVDQEKFKDAVSVLDEGVKKTSEPGRLLFMKGVYQEKAGDRSGCIETMREVIKTEPSNASAFNYLGYLFAENGENLDEAESLIKKALELKPEDGYYLDSLGWVYFQKKDYKKALEYLDKAIKKTPKEGVVLEHLARAYELLGDTEKADSFFKQALETKLESRDKGRIEGLYKEFLEKKKK